MTGISSTALVTGASRGIGRGIALELAQRGLHSQPPHHREEDLAALAAELTDAGAPSVVPHTSLASETGRPLPQSSSAMLRPTPPWTR